MSKVKGMTKPVKEQDAVNIQMPSA